MSGSATDRSVSVAGALLSWFDAGERDVPWRTETDPFAILVAEVMAQQTRIETVRSYYARFRDRFPTVADLAAAEQDEVLKLWEGLGYYARARNLHAAARVIVEKLDGVIPQTVEGLLKLPGIGPYTAGAVASLAFGAAEPAVDGNARRVLSRIFDLVDSGPGPLDGVARGLLAADPTRAGALNQAIMDLGSEVCSPKRPSCPGCPLSSDCLALARDTVGIRPPRRPKPRKPERSAVTVVIARGSEVFVVQRPRDGLLGGLWDFPSVPDGPALSAGRLAEEVEAAFGLTISVGPQIHLVKHTFTHFRLTLRVHEAEWREGEPLSSSPWMWASKEDLERLAFPVYHRNMIASVLGPRFQASGVGTS